jgi:signal peptidase
MRVAALILVLGAAAAALAWQQGYRLYIVHTGSMEPTLRPGDAVLDAPAPATVRPGEVVTFRAGSGPGSVVTHRVSSVSEGLVHTQGDANRSVDPWSLRSSDLLGATVAVLPRAGYVLYYLQQPSGLASLATAALAVTLLWGLFFPPDPATERSEPPASASGPGPPEPGPAEPGESPPVAAGPGPAEPGESPPVAAGPGPAEPGESPPVAADPGVSSGGLAAFTAWFNGPRALPLARRTPRHTGRAVAVRHAVG